MAGFNPIKSVNGKAVPCPSMGGYKWDMEDVSASDAGRTEDLVMHKKRQGQVEAISLSWNNIPTATVSQILKAFQPEYIMVEYLSPLEGRFVTKEFYVGNRSAPLYNTCKGLWESVSFKIVERRG